jgi:hypothetical protein
MAADARGFTRMKTLHVDCGREMGGGQWQVLYLVERLKDAVLMARESSPLLAEARKRGLDARALSFVSLWKAARKAELVHAHDSRAHTLAAIAGGAPLVVSRRVGFPMKPGFFSDRKYAAARMYLAVSKFVAARLGERLKCRKIRVVHDGVPIPERASSLTGGAVAIAKGDRDAILRAGVPIHFVSDLWQDLSTARVCVYWSEMEGLGSGALAAMASGVPVIASRVGGLPEVIDHERTGLLVDGPDQLAGALRRLTANIQEAEEMGRRARETAIEKFSVEAMVQATMRAYEEAVE